MKKKSPFPVHTHFIGIQLPADLSERIMDFREYMHTAFSCKSGFSTPPHITLVPPFLLPEYYEGSQVECGVARAVSLLKGQNIMPFDVSLSGFGAFSDRTLFVNVENTQAPWETVRSVLYRSLKEEIPEAVKKESKTFVPHITVANRDIPKGTMDSALKHFAHIDFTARFSVSDITVFVRNARGLWEVL